jgi:hypothetical protein
MNYNQHISGNGRKTTQKPSRLTPSLIADQVLLLAVCEVSRIRFRFNICNGVNAGGRIAVVVVVEVVGSDGGFGHVIMEVSKFSRVYIVGLR